MRWMHAAAILVMATLATSAHAQAKVEMQDRWFYYATNLLVDKNIDELEKVFQRAGNAGYNGVLLSDSKFGRLGEMEPRYFQNLDRVKRIAETCKLQIIPAVFPVGYSESLLSQDPNLAEGLPVKDALFVVKDGQARLAADPPVSLKAGNMSDLKLWDFKDSSVVKEGASARITNWDGKNARLYQKVKVQPFRQYHLSVHVRTKNFAGKPEAKILAKTKNDATVSLAFSNLGVKATQDWGVHHVVFNSLDHDEVLVYLGVWEDGAKGGSLWWTDAKLEEVGLVNLLRRDSGDGTPLIVKTDDGKVLEEGKDYEKVIDPRMGTVPWKGAYEVWHPGPPIKVNGLPDGTRLRVSYYHAITVGDGQVMICPSESKTLEVMKDHARRVFAALGGAEKVKAFFMSHDEIRVLGWDAACAKRGLTSGQILAENVQACAAILRELNKDAKIYVWSDMFDPNHNAHKDYYLVRGDLAGSWEGLAKDVIVAVWYQQKARESIKFFTARGNSVLIAGYYDGKPEGIQDWLIAAKEAAAPGPLAGTVQGVMYTTWANRYADLEAFLKAVEQSQFGGK